MTGAPDCPAALEFLHSFFVCWLLLSSWHSNCLDTGNVNVMKGKYIAAASAAVAGLAVYYFFGRKKAKPVTAPQKENERHHLTNAFAKAKQVAVGR
jgi:hypothetical protein